LIIGSGRSSTEHAVAQHRREAPALHRLVGVLTVGLEERHPPSGLGGQSRESFFGLFEHRRRGVEQRHVVPGLGERK